MNEWKTYKLGEIARFQTGKLNSNAAIEGGKYPFFTCSPTTLHIDNYAFDQEAILLAGNNAEGNFSIKYYNGKFNAYQRTYIIEAITEYCETRYLFYSLKLYLQHFKYISQGTSTKFLTASILRNIPISLPPLETQKRIADILSVIDDEIELNRRINANLEQQAQALYKSWFVDFEPFGGKMPEDWRVGTLGDIIETIESGSRPKGGSETSGVPSIGAEKIERFGHYEYSGEKFINRDYFHKMKRGHVKNGDVLLYKDGAYTGKISMVLDGFPYRECAVNEHVFILRTVASKYQFFLYCLMSYPDIRKMVYTLASAKAAQPGLNQTELLGVNIVVPSYNMIKKFNHSITPHMHQIAINALESSRLAQLRDTLSPKLMSGDITV